MSGKHKWITARDFHEGGFPLTGCVRCGVVRGMHAEECSSERPPSPVLVDEAVTERYQPPNISDRIARIATEMTIQAMIFGSAEIVETDPWVWQVRAPALPMGADRPKEERVVCSTLYKVDVRT